MKDYIVNELERRISSFQQLPYLFVGTGLSMRYSHAPSWNALLFEIWTMINPTKKERDFNKLKQMIERDIRNQKPELNTEEQKYYVNPMLASVIEKDFNDRYYSEDGFDTTVFSDDENDVIIDKHLNPFKFLVAKQTRQMTIDETLPAFKELAFLIQNQNKFAGIITTNYDELLEEIFKDFSVLVGQDSLLVANSLNIFEIFKIHGCCSKPDSIILTEKDYINFEKKLKYLSAKLLTIFVEHPIIFIGYGLGDVNIRKIFSEIAECLTVEQLEKIKDNFIFISPAFGKEETFNKNTLTWGSRSIIINEFILEDYSAVYQALSKIQSSMPIKLARKLQDMVCNFVYSAEAKNNILFGDINSPDLDDEKAAIYFGKADTVTQIGFSYFEIDEILEDILFNNKPYLVNTQLIDKTFKSIRSSAGSTLLPIYKYIKALGYPLSDIPSNYNIVDGYDDSDIRPTSSDRKHYIKEGSNFSRISEIEEAYPNHIPKQVANIKEFAEKITTEDLEGYLKKHYNTELYKRHKSLFRKLIALYDFKKYS
ncbi:MAG: SIR2 family protein [Lachnospiraceae bacterium]|nr:SIR2 family protein [Lachnospiraceae bacterium]